MAFKTSIDAELNTESFILHLPSSLHHEKTILLHFHNPVFICLQKR